MHDFCEECGIHLGRLKGDEKSERYTACKLLHHKIIKVSDDWDTPKDPEQVSGAEKIKLHEYGPEHNNRHARFNAQIVARGSLETYYVKDVYMCLICNNEKVLLTDEYRTRHPIPNCPDCKQKMTHQPVKSVVDKIRTLILEEPYAEAKNKMPSTFEAEITGELTGETSLGQVKELTGIFRSIPKPKGNTNRIVIDIKKIVDSQKRINLEPTKEDLEKFIKLQKEDWLKILTESYAPEIFGMKDVKESIIISLVSGSKVGNLRGDINVFMIGDPSTAKSRLLKFIPKLIEKSTYTIGKSSSAAGLVMGIDKTQDGRNMLRLGPVVLNHGGVVAIDEINTMPVEQRVPLLEVMEQQTASLHKIGSNLTMPSETIIIAAANPKSSKYNTDLTILQNVSMPEALLSRFDLIWLIRDIPHRDNDYAKMKHIIKVRQENDSDSLLTEEELAKIVNYARVLKPKLTDESTKKLQEYFINLRGYEQQRESLPIDWRSFEALIRIATAYAKLRFSHTIDTIDTDNAIKLYSASLESFGMKTSSQMQQSLHNTMPKNKDEYVLKVINAKTDDDGYLDIDELKLELSHDTKYFNGSYQKASNYIANLIRHGLLVETKTNQYIYVQR